MYITQNIYEHKRKMHVLESMVVQNLEILLHISLLLFPLVMTGKQRAYSLLRRTRNAQTHFFSGHGEMCAAD